MRPFPNRGAAMPDPHGADERRPPNERIGPWDEARFIDWSKQWDGSPDVADGTWVVRASEAWSRLQAAEARAERAEKALREIRDSDQRTDLRAPDLRKIARAALEEAGEQ